MSLPEFNKVARVDVTPQVRGLSGQITIPATWTNNNTGDFFNFYLGLGSVECGVSNAAGQPYLHWFVNNNYANDAARSNGPYTAAFGPGTSHALQLYLDTSGYIHFVVDGTEVYKSTGVHSATTGRFIIAAAQVINSSADYGGTWRVYHDAASFTSMKYMDASGNWQNVTSSNASGTKTHQPNANTPGGPYPAPQAPVDYTATFMLDSNKFYGALR
ncbi:hypothetical protein [Deinococcus sp.]|uniref:hypothetical protein n=1 Tax=Deinococcus sp. TaxID=47478 RepID=UPI0025BDC7B7|nr:hypothetical protein [Deinococcus sp.]